jgi:hypothetical protein
VSPGIAGPCVTVPSMRPPIAAPVPLTAALPVVVLDPPEPVPPLPADPDEFAVPKLFVPGAVGTFAELPAPLRSLPELFKPPGVRRAAWNAADGRRARPRRPSVWRSYCAPCAGRGAA